MSTVSVQTVLILLASKQNSQYMLAGFAALEHVKWSHSWWAGTRECFAREWILLKLNLGVLKYRLAQV